MEHFNEHRVERQVLPIGSTSEKRTIEEAVYTDRLELLEGGTSQLARRLQALSPELKQIFAHEVFKDGWLELDLDIEAERDPDEVETLMHAVEAYLGIQDPAYRMKLSNKLAKQLQA